MQIPSTSGKFSLIRKRAFAFWLAVPVLAFILACHTQVNSEKPSLQQKASSTSPRDAASLCDSIKEIGVLPIKDEAVPDPAYNALASAGEYAIPCLIHKITDKTKMKDPRKAPTVGMVAVGDTAFFVLIDVAKIDQAGFLELLPPEIRKAYEREGIYSYFRLIDEDHNRQKLQDAAVKWYEKKYGRSLP